MATLENIFVSICIIGLCVLMVAAILSGVAMLVISIINLIKVTKEDGK